ncbi:MAG: acetyl-CoA carboxylase biotin carboxyl carrier protein [Candidatus Hydrogenedentes bacterium]|nr:acetyl-CoA carboxylase biotin carboxyl carrier protein [Candidatus Hydrogenedentota bacterium]
MDLKELKELVSLLESSELSELEIEEEGRRIRLTKKPDPVVAQAVAIPAPAAEPVAAAPLPAAGPPAEATLADEGLVSVDSPMVGTFYVSPAPGEPSYVQVGDSISADQTVCIVEAMKIMNEVAAKVAGTVERVLVEGGEPVEFGQPLFAIRPAS